MVTNAPSCHRYSVRDARDTRDISFDASTGGNLVLVHLPHGKPSQERRGQSSNADQSLLVSDIVHRIDGCLTLTLKVLR